MKRRIFSLLISCILMCSLSVSVYAEETAKYTLGELGLTVSMPSDYVIFTRGIDANDPNLSSYGLTKADMSSP